MRIFPGFIVFSVFDTEMHILFFKLQKKKSIIFKDLQLALLLVINFLMESHKHFAMWLFNFLIKCVFIDRIGGKRCGCALLLSWFVLAEPLAKILLESVSKLLTCRHALLGICQEYFWLEITHLVITLLSTKKHDISDTFKQFVAKMLHFSNYKLISHISE